MHRTLRLAAGAMLAALVLVACGTSAADEPTTSDGADRSAAAAPSSAPESMAAEPAAPEAGTDLTACEIVTAGEVEAAVGLDSGTVAEGELTESPTALSPGHTECDYEGDWGRIVVSLTPEDGANLFDAARGSYADASDRDIAGADGAFWSEDQGRGFFWKGAVTAMFQVSFLADGGDHEQIILTLGQDAIDKVE
jgi:hypothetical protein